MGEGSGLTSGKVNSLFNCFTDYENADPKLSNDVSCHALKSENRGRYAYLNVGTPDLDILKIIISLFPGPHNDTERPFTSTTGEVHILLQQLSLPVLWAFRFQAHQTQ